MNKKEIDIDELKRQILSRLIDRAIRVSTLKKPHTFLKAVGTHEIERILDDVFAEFKS